MSIENKELTVLKSQVSQLENQANAVIIATPKENALAIDLKAKLKEIGQTIKARKEEITKPLNAALKSARELFAPIEEQYEIAENIVGRKLLDYKQKVEAEARAMEAKIAARVEKGTMKIETAERKIEQIPTMQKTIKTSFGSVQFRKIKKVRITDLNLIPDQYWVIDEVKLRKDVLAGIVVPGAIMFEEEIV